MSAGSAGQAAKESFARAANRSGRVTAARLGDPGDPAPAGTWFLEFLRRELAPYPGRVSLVIRMTIATTLAMLVIDTAHIPSGALGAFFALILSRESLRNTAQQAWLNIAVYALATVYVVLGVALFVDSPVTHFLWVIASFYLIFFVMRTAANYSVAAGFSFLIATAIPIWDRAGSTNVKVSLTLYTLWSVMIGSLCTVFVELVYRSFHPEDPVLAGIADRLEVTAQMLRAAADGKAPAKSQGARLLQYAMVGPSSLRRQLIRAGQLSQVRARASAVVALSDRLVELCAASLDAVSDEDRGSKGPTREDAERLRALARAVRDQAGAIKALRDVSQIGASKVPRWNGTQARSEYLPILPELERNVSLLSEIFNSFDSSREGNQAAESGAKEAGKSARTVGTLLGSKPSAAFVPDAFTNREHLVFALRGCLATTVCYLFYNGVDWPGINTCVATCIITALATIGSSRQKQLLRVAGAVVGGFVIALPAQVFLLPRMDSITAFTVFFAAVTAFSAWFTTASSRLSYFGLQVALAFYLVNLQEPFRQISLSVARDRVVGVIVGLLAMWLVFDQIAAPLATDRMNTLLRTNLNLLGDMACAVADVGPGMTGGALERFQQLRDKINDSFSQMNAQADAVQFEFGPQRRQKLRERDRMQAMQPPMRSLFLLEISLAESEYLPSGRRVDARERPALRDFLEQNRGALRSIAALPITGAPEFAEDAKRATENAVAGVRKALDGVKTDLGDAPGHESGAVLTLCTGIVSSLGALERAAAGRPGSG